MLQDEEPLKELFNAHDTFKEAFEEVVTWKDAFLKRQLSPSIKAEFTVIFSKLWRSKFHLSKSIESMQFGSIKVMARMNTKSFVNLAQKETETDKLEELFKASMRRITVLEAVIQKQRIERTKEAWEFIIGKAVKMYKESPKKYSYCVDLSKLNADDLRIPKGTSGVVDVKQRCKSEPARINFKSMMA